LTNHKHHTRHLLAIPINVLCDVCDLSIKIWAFEHEKTNGIANKCLVWCLWFVNTTNFYWQITQDIYWQCHWFSHLQMLKF
jgi:hypothetical protein